MSDRNRGDFRYRNRLSFERNFSVRNYMFTPYVRGELFYDIRVDKSRKIRS